MHKSLLILLLPFFVWSQNYLWPTNASRYMSSGFCEYRPHHFHSALDIKTWDKEGYPCYAVADGIISQIRISPFGYGKALYIKLKDGRMTVYGHLQRFTPGLEKEIRRRQLAKKRYSIIWNKVNIPVKKGEIVAYSGQTGIGVPHLHFEVRDPAGHPLNPLQFYKNIIKDHSAPKLLALLIIPRDENSRINGSFLPKIFTLKQMDKDIYIIKEPLLIKGRVGLALRGFDRADGVYNKFDFYRLKLLAEGKEIFRSQYDRLDFAKTRQIDISIYYPLKMKSGRVFTKLFLEPYNTLSFYRRDLGSGIITMQGHPVHFSIEASDYFGNLSAVTGVLQADSLSPSGAQVIRQMHELVFLSITLPQHLKKMSFMAQDINGQSAPVDYFEVLQSKHLGTMQKLLLKLKLKKTRIRALRCNYATNGGFETHLTVGLSANSLPPHCRIVNTGKFVDFSAAGLPPESRIEISSSKLNVSTPLNNLKCEFVFPARKIGEDSLRLKIFKQDLLLEDSVLYFHLLLPGKAQSFAFAENKVLLQSTSASMYDTTLFSFRQLLHNEWSTPKNILNSNSFPVCGPLYRLRPADQIFKGALRLSIKYDSLCTLWDKLGLYKINKKGRPVFSGSHHDSLRHFISARIRSLGDFVILADTVAPQLKIINLYDGLRLSSLKQIVFHAEDSLSGIGSGENITVTLDRKFVLPEWDPERNRIVARTEQKLSSGEHKIRIVVKDRAGNRREKNIKVLIVKTNRK